MTTNFEPPERNRRYYFPGGDILEYQNVISLEVRPSGNHRLVLKDGTHVIVAAGWLAIELDINNWTV